MTDKQKPEEHCGHECVCAVLSLDKNDDGKSPCSKTPDCKHDTRLIKITSKQQQRKESIITEDDLNELIGLICSEPGNEIDLEKRSKMGEILRRTRSHIKFTNTELTHMAIAVRCHMRGNKCEDCKNALEKIAILQDGHP